MIQTRDVALHDRAAVAPPASSPDKPPPLPTVRLTAREDQILVYLSKGLRNAEIASALGTSVGAAKANVFHALQNLKKLLGTV